MTEAEFMAMADKPEMQGLFDNLIKKLFETFLAGLDFDFTKLDKKELALAMPHLGNAAKPMITVPGDYDDKAIDFIVAMIVKRLESSNPFGPLVVGAAGEYMESTSEFSANEVDGFLATCEAHESNKARVRRHPKIMRILHATKDGQAVFTDDDRRKIVADRPTVGFPWVMLIQLLGSIVIPWILEWLSNR